MKPQYKRIKKIKECRKSQNKGRKKIIKNKESKLGRQFYQLEVLSV
jgi:hypothetical protein